MRHDARPTCGRVCPFGTPLAAVVSPQTPIVSHAHGGSAHRELAERALRPPLPRAGRLLFARARQPHAQGSNAPSRRARAVLGVEASLPAEEPHQGPRAQPSGQARRRRRRLRADQGGVGTPSTPRWASPPRARKGALHAAPPEGVSSRRAASKGASLRALRRALCTRARAHPGERGDVYTRARAKAAAHARCASPTSSPGWLTLTT